MPRRPRARTQPTSTRPRAQTAPRVARPRLRARHAAIAAALLLLTGLAAWRLAPVDPSALRDQAEAAARAGDWERALEFWRSYNQSPRAGARTYLAEARACLALDRAGQAEAALRRAAEADPADPEPWRLLLEIARVEDRPVDAAAFGREAMGSVPPGSRREVLRNLTLALLADLPDDVARRALDRWAAADPADVEAAVARLRRAAALPRTGDPAPPERLEALAALVESYPANTSAREAYVSALADLGAVDLGRPALDAWPAGSRDARYDRLLGRWLLEYGTPSDRPAAVEALGRALATLPHDWRTRARLARAYQSDGRAETARVEAEAVARLREALDPSRLGPRLGAALARPDDPSAMLDLAALCAGVGLSDLSEAWRAEAARPAPATPAGLAPEPLPSLPTPSRRR